jgi:hypothetical protein
MHSKLLSVAFALFLVGCARIDSDEAREIAQQFLADKVPDATLLAYKIYRKHGAWQIEVTETEEWRRKNENEKTQSWPLAVEVDQRGNVTGFI